MVMLTGLADGLRKHGLTVIEIDGWKTRGWAGRGFYGTPKGVLHHHTATTSARRYSTGSPTLNMLIGGRSDLPGPLCNRTQRRSVAVSRSSSQIRPVPSVAPAMPSGRGAVVTLSRASSTTVSQRSKGAGIHRTYESALTAQGPDRMRVEALCGLQIRGNRSR